MRSVSSGVRQEVWLAVSASLLCDVALASKSCKRTKTRGSMDAMDAMTKREDDVTIHECLTEFENMSQGEQIEARRCSRGSCRTLT